MAVRTSKDREIVGLGVELAIEQAEMAGAVDQKGLIGAGDR